jgi:hypothetical protein
MKCFVKNLGTIKVLNPMYGDIKLQMFPFNSKLPILLPDGFKLWEKQINEFVKLIPYQEQAVTHYLTIDSKFFTEDGFLRREGIHIDGNFCVDPNFNGNSWPAPLTWSGVSIVDGNIIERHVSPYNLKIPIGEYVSETKGGFICASSYAGCDAWMGDIPNAVGDEGAYPEALLHHAKKITLKENNIYFLSSNTPHETTFIPKGTRRTLIRITLNHNYENYVFDKNENIQNINSY